MEIVGLEVVVRLWEAYTLEKLPDLARSFDLEDFLRFGLWFDYKVCLVALPNSRCKQRGEDRSVNQPASGEAPLERAGKDRRELVIDNQSSGNFVIFLALSPSRTFHH